MITFIVSVASGLVTAALAYAYGVARTRLQYMRRFGHLREFVPPDRRVQIVLPSAEVNEFIVKGEGVSATFPPNVLIMPMCEGSGIARLVLALRSMPSPMEVHLTTDDAVSSAFGLTISIGGPSVNMESRRLLNLYHSDFTLHYPEHTASYRSTSFVPRRNERAELLEDFGFLFISKSTQARFVVCCGVWGIGTELAIRGLLELRQLEADHLLRHSGPIFLAFRAPVDRFRGGDLELVLVGQGERTHAWRV